MGADFYSSIEEMLHSVKPEMEIKSKLFHILKIDERIYYGIREKSHYKMDYFEIVVSSSEKSTFTIGESKFTNPGNNISFVAPNQLVSWKGASSEKPGIKYIIMFELDLLSPNNDKFNFYKSFPFFNINTIPFYYVNEEQLKTFFELSENMYEEFKNFDGHSLEIIKSYLTILLQKAKKMLSPQNLKSNRFERKHELTFSFENLIKNSANKRKTISEYAMELNVSSVYLSECVKHTTGKTAKKVIDEYLILEAKSILLQSNKSISEISYMLGFEDPSNFRKYFKTHTGLSPKDFRQTT